MLCPKSTTGVMFIIVANKEKVLITSNQKFIYFSVICHPSPYRSLLPNNVISPMTF